MKLRTLWKLLRFLLTSGFLFSIWLLFSTEFSAFSFFAGLGGALLLGLFTYPVFLAEHEAGLRSFFPNPFWLLFFIIRLVGALYAASFKMLAAILSGKCSPGIVHFRTRLASDLGRFTLANAITLTPGTVTLDLNDTHLTVFWFFTSTRHSKAAGEEIKGTLEYGLSRVWM